MKVLLHALFLIFLTVGGLSAQTVWTGNVDSDWDNAANWSAGVPTSGSFVTIPGTAAGGNFPVFTGGPILDFTIQNAGTLTFNSLVYNNGTIVNFVGGIINNDGQFFNSGGGNIDNDGFFNNNGDFTNYGTFDSALSGETTVAAGATFTHAGLFFKSAGPFINNGTVINTSNMRATNFFENFGSFTNYNSFEAPFGSTFNNHGTGSIDNLAGTIFVLNGAFTNDAPINNLGDISLQSATVGVNNSTITNSGLLEVAGSLTNEGTIINNNETTITDGGTLTNNSVFTNNGTITLSICGSLVQNGGNTIVAPVLNDGLIYLLNGTVEWTNLEFGNEFTDLSNTKPPVAGCRAGVVLFLDENGEATLTAAQVDKGSYGSCGATLASVTIDRTDFTTADLGAQFVNLTVTDDLGVVSTCQAVVTILAYIPPVVPVDDPDIDFTCPADITVTGLPGAGNAEANWTEPTATSTCTVNGGGGGGGGTGCENLPNSFPGFNLLGEYGGHKYYASTAAHSWTTAQANCVANGGHLVVINDEAENTFIFNNMSTATGSIWTGLNTVSSPNDFQWVNGDPVTYLNWQAGEPNGNGIDHAARMKEVSGEWTDKFTSDNYDFFMEIACVPTLPSCADLSNNLNGFSFIGELNDSKYFYSTNTATWADAQAQALIAGGNLVSISSAQENDFIVNATTGSSWIGLTDELTEGNFIWVNGEAVTYTNWKSGEPNDYGTGEDHTEILASGLWNDQSGNSHRRYVIEIPCSNQSSCQDLALTFVFDNYPEDISWEVLDAQGNIQASGGNYGTQPDGSTVVENICLSDGCYDLRILDSYGDGLCCSYGNGSYALTDVDGNVLASGANFTYSETTNFCLTTGNPGPPVVTQIRGPQSGQQFPNGVTEVAYEVTDPCGNQEICTFEVTVESTPSEITLTDCPADLTINTLPGATSAILNWGPVNATTTCFSGGLEIQQSQGPEIGEILRVKDGAQLVAYTATDSCGNFAACVFTVTVVASPSEITMANCPADITAQLNPGESSTTVTWDAPTGTTTCFTGTVNVQQLEGPASGSSFAGGTTSRIIYLVSDECGNTEICIFSVIVNACPVAGTACDDGDPKTINDVEDGLCNCVGTLTTLTIECPADITVDALPGATNAVVDWSDATGLSDCNIGAVSVSQTAGPASGTNLPLGITTITYEATDACTNVATCSFTITVNATTSTVTLNCPADITVAAIPGDLTAQVSWIAPDPSSDCVIQPVNLIQTAGPANGGSFLEGTTTVSYEATDGCGESASCSFTVTVTTSCIDSDGDGVCAADDCDDNDASIPAAPGTACDDGDATTSNDVILADGCTCAGVTIDPCDALGGDSDGDGVCADNDCDDNDASIPAAPGTTCDDGDATTSNDVILADGCTCAGVTIDPCDALGGDSDGDGVCADNDCDDNDASIPAAPGTACDDGDATTSNDVILADGCTCAGVTIDPCDALGGDSDGDGVCADNDCDDNDASIPAAPGTACDDGDATTTNDVILADGCTCEGTPDAGPDCANIVITPGNGSIIVSGLAGVPITTIQIFDPFWTEVFNCAGNCDPVEEVVTGLNPGTHFVKVSFYTATWTPICSVEDYYEVTAGDPCDALGGDADGDGVCAADDCDDNDASLPAVPGTSCDDGDPDTTNDVILADGCGCAGTPPGGDPCDNLGGDMDGDGVCAATDCDDNDASIPAAPGTTCDDGDATTTNDVILADGCTCAGTPVGPDCANITITTGDGFITVSGLDGAPVSTLQIFDPVYNEVFNCAGNCNGTEVATGLADGTYFVKAVYYTASWSPICSVEDFFIVETGTGGNPCDNLGGDADGDGVCAVNDCDDNDASLPAPVGSSCDDGDAATTNDEIQADGCTCEGTIPGTGPDCANIVVTPADGQITVSGLSNAPITSVQIFDPVWNEVFNCAGNCDPNEEVITGLTPGLYFVKVAFYDATWNPVCFVEDFYEVYATSGPELRKIIEFTATKGTRQVDLLWGTNTGDVNDHFLIERSADGINYEPLLITENQFTGQGTYLYEEADKNPIIGWNYYRLKQVHIDGTYVLTAERRVQFTQDLNEFALFPNPVEAEVFVHLKSFSGESVTIDLVNNLGQMVQHRELDIAPASPIGLDVSQLQAGVYSVTVKVEGKKRMTKLLVITRR